MFECDTVFEPMFVSIASAGRSSIVLPGLKPTLRVLLMTRSLFGTLWGGGSGLRGSESAILLLRMRVSAALRVDCHNEFDVVVKDHQICLHDHFPSGTHNYHKYYNTKSGEKKEKKRKIIVQEAERRKEKKRKKKEK